MNKTKVVVIWCTVAGVVLLSTFPPWVTAVGGLQLGYAPILSPPDINARIDMSRLMLEWFLVAVIGVALFVTAAEVTPMLKAPLRLLAMVVAAPFRFLRWVGGSTMVIFALVFALAFVSYHHHKSAAWDAFRGSIDESLAPSIVAGTEKTENLKLTDRFGPLWSWYGFDGYEFLLAADVKLNNSPNPVRASCVVYRDPASLFDFLTDDASRWKFKAFGPAALAARPHIDWTEFSKPETTP